MTTAGTSQTSSHIQADDERVSISRNPIDATRMKGAYVSWQIKGHPNGPIISPTNQLTQQITSKAASIDCQTTDHTVDTYKFSDSEDTNSKKEDSDGRGEEDPQPYTVDETITLSGPDADGKKNLVISLSGNSSGVLTNWVLGSK